MRSRWSLPSFATVVTFAFLVVSSLSPAEEASAVDVATVDLPGQAYAIAEPQHPGAVRDAYGVSRRPPPAAAAPAVGTPDPGTAQAIAYDMVLARGWNQSEFDCLVALWNRESHWNVYAHNTSSGAYGIPQALPGTKMATAGADWQTNPATQITWGLGYIAGRYGTPCGAWAHSENQGWY